MATTAAMQKRAKELAPQLASQVLPALTREFRNSHDSVSAELVMPPAMTRELYTAGDHDADAFGREVLDVVCTLVEAKLPGSLVTAGRSQDRPNITYRQGDTAYFTVNASHR